MNLKTTFGVIVTLVLGSSVAILFAVGVPMQAKTAPSTPSISDLAWMSGDWQTAKGGRARIDEHWTLPAGGTMLGVGRTIVGDKTVGFEFLRIEQRADGIFYVASPNGGPTTDFKLTRLVGQEVMFENPEHDFPKRIIYRKKSDGSMVATVDGGDKTKSQNFAYLPMRN